MEQKVDTTALIAGRRETFRYEYPAPAPIPNPFVFYVRPINDIEERTIASIGRPLFQRFVLGSWIDSEGKSHDEADHIYDAFGEEILIKGWDPIEYAAHIEVMQNPPQESGRYSALEILRIMATEPEIFEAMQRDFTPHMLGKGWKKKGYREIMKKPSGGSSNQETDILSKSQSSTSGLNTSGELSTASQETAA